MPSRRFESNPWPSGLRQARLLSNAGLHHSLEGRRDLVHQARLGWRVVSSEFEEPVTSCLQYISIAMVSSELFVLLRTSRQIRPSLSMLGWYILVRKRILGGVIG